MIPCHFFEESDCFCHKVPSLCVLSSNAAPMKGFNSQSGYSSLREYKRHLLHGHYEQRLNVCDGWLTCFHRPQSGSFLVEVLSSG